MSRVFSCTRVILCGLFSSAVAFAQTEVNQDRTDAVEAGEITEAKASWWGFNPEDATDALQKAINSGVAKLTVDNVGKPWIVRPIRLAGAQEILFEEGVEVVAKPGEFKGRGDCLFLGKSIENITLRGYGATFRMQKADYDGPNYRKAEWRHTLSIKSCENVKVYGLTLADSGGDGIYLGTGKRWVTNKNVHIKDCVCTNNYRQGISVITAENLIIENTVMEDTSGTAPRAGIDFEPNHAEERLVNVVMRDCVTRGNAGNGYQFHLPNLNSASEPASMRFENCRAVGDQSSAVRLYTDDTVDSAVRGTFDFVNCEFSETPGPGISIAKPAGRGLVRFDNCTVSNVAVDSPQAAPIIFQGRRFKSGAIGGVEFTGCVIDDPVDRPPMAYLSAGSGLPLKKITGTLVLGAGDERRTVDLTEEVLGKWMPVAALKNIPRIDFEDKQLQPLEGDTCADAEGITWPTIRGAGRLLLYAAEGDDVSLIAHNLQVGGYAGNAMTVKVTAPSGEVAVSAEAPFKESAEVSFEAPRTGVYRVTADAGRNRFRITDCTVPIAVDARGGPVNLIHSPGRFRFWVPPGTEQFGVRIAGAGLREAIRAELINPNGKVVETVDNRFQLYQFEVTLPEASTGEAWTLQLARPSDTTWEDHYVALRGVPPLFAPEGVPLLVPGN